MGAGGLTRAVADAGPLLHLYEIGAFPLFTMFNAISVAHAVWKETAGKHRLPDDILQSPPFTIQPPVDEPALQEFIEHHKLESLHSGEIESLYLCHTQSIPLFLTDDLSARDAAKHVNITPAGSVGILLRAYREQRFSLEDAVENLRSLQSHSSLFVTSTIIEEAIERIRK